MRPRPGVESRLASVRARCAAERDDAVALLERARDVLDEVVEPETLRAPVWWHLSATIELVQAHRTLFGLPVNYALDMAAAIVGEPPPSGVLATPRSAGARDDGSNRAGEVR